MRRARLRTVCILALLACLTACTTSVERWLAATHLPDAAAVRERLVQRSPYGIAPDEDVLALSPELRAFIDARLRGLGQRERLRRLGEMFRRGGELELTYSQDITRPARGVFATRQGNCLSFTHLFVAMARELGLHARFREERVATSWARLGEVLVINRHITVWGSLQGATYEADFGDFADAGQATLREVVSDTRARAQYFNNLGAEAMARGDARAAVPLFNRALLLDDGLGYVWTNLGTTLNRLGHADDAELAFRHALRLDPASVPALLGLARIVHARGEARLARALTGEAGSLDARNPFRHYAAAEAALARHAPVAAERSLRTAIDLAPNEAEFHFELGRVMWQSGRRDAAIAAFERVQALARDTDQMRIYAERLRALVGATAAPTTHGPAATPPPQVDLDAAAPAAAPQSMPAAP